MSRADDMESLFYLLAFLLNGELPWLTSSAIKNKVERLSFVDIRRMKSNKSVDDLWKDDQLPSKRGPNNACL